MKDAIGSERRLLRRWPGLDRAVRFRTEVGAPLRPATIWDLSLLGVGILADTELPAGTSVTLHPLRSQKPLEVTAEVRHATSRPDGSWLIGCSFPRTLTIDEVQAL